MSNAIKELSKLNFDGKEWVCELRNKVCLNGDVSELDIEDAFSKLHSTVRIPELTLPDAIPEESRSFKTLWRLYENTNVAGLYDNRIIEFSPNLTVVYGKNGSGKSSYYRVLKDAFHSSQNILGNIYTPSSNRTIAKMDFIDKSKHQEYQRKGHLTGFSGDDLLTVNWIPGTQRKYKIKFCDQEILLSSLSKKDTGWSVDRYKLGYYDNFRSAIEKVEVKLTSKVGLLNSEISGNIDILVNGLKLTSPESIKIFLRDNKTNLTLINSKLLLLHATNLEEGFIEQKAALQREAVVSIQDFTSAIDLANSKIVALETMIKLLSEMSLLLGNISVIKEKRDNLNKLKDGLDLSKFDQYKLLFNPSTNRDKFIELIKKIAETALLFGYENYPKDADKCFYCNQNLPTENKSLVIQIHEIIQNEVNREIDALAFDIRSFITKIERLNVSIPLVELNEIGDLYYVSNKKIIPLHNILNGVLKNEALLLFKTNIETEEQEGVEIKEEQENVQLMLCSCISERDCLSHRVAELRAGLVAIEKSKNIANEGLKNSEDQEFIVNQKTVIKRTIEAIAELQKYQSAGGLFQGYKLKVSKDKGRVEEELIRNDYLDKFNRNLDFFDLSKRDKITRPFSNPGGKSKVEGRIEANGRQFALSNILSEGEAKVYSLCDWLTELEFDENSILIFDDPITSLDQVNIAKVVEKIVLLSQNYQTIVFTHNFEFYHRLVQQSLGGAPLNKAKCEICSTEIERQQCVGLIQQTGRTHKCCSYYQVEYILQPGQLREEVMFLSLNWEQRIEILRKNLLAGDIREADKHLRTTINNFFERFVLNDIKRQVYKNNDLIKEWRDMRDIDASDYDALMEIHNKVSAEGTIHEPSMEVRTIMGVQDYIREFNKTIKAMNNIRSFQNPSPPQVLSEIVI